MELDNYGFVEVGKWKLKEHLKSGVAFELYSFKEERVVYAFVIDDEAKYIGVCDNTSTTLKNRMSRYQSLQGAGANERIANKIKDCLKRGKAVEIFALKPESTLQYKGLNVDLVKGLENPLIERLKPEWNIQK
ncbi:MAG: GIY-YIG nuclease family protein [Candidatus Methanospirareceae archaeon]